MDRTKPGKPFSRLIIVSCIFLLFSQVASLEIGTIHSLMAHNYDYFGLYSTNTDGIDIIQKAVVFHNRKGLKEKIRIEGPLKELTATSETNLETIDELIEHISIWIPKMYRDYFLINPRCIIILESKINEEGKSQVRFGVAMEYVPKSSVPELIHI